MQGRIGTYAPFEGQEADLMHSIGATPINYYPQTALQAFNKKTPVEERR